MNDTLGYYVIMSKYKYVIMLNCTEGEAFLALLLMLPGYHSLVSSYIHNFNNFIQVILYVMNID